MIHDTYVQYKHGAASFPCPGSLPARWISEGNGNGSGIIISPHIPSGARRGKQASKPNYSLGIGNPLELRPESAWGGTVEQPPAEFGRDTTRARSLDGVGRAHSSGLLCATLCHTGLTCRQRNGRVGAGVGFLGEGRGPV